MWNDGDYYDASFGIHKCRRYHAKLRDFYQALHSYTTAANAFAASGAFIAIVGSLSVVAGILAAVVALASLFDSIFAYESKARLHHELCARFTRLAADLEKLPETPVNLADVRAKRLLIEADEPGEKRLVDLMASNEEARSRGIAEKDLHPLSWWQCWFGYFFTFGLRRLEREKAKREAERAAGPSPQRLLPPLPESPRASWRNRARKRSS